MIQPLPSPPSQQLTITNIPPSFLLSPQWYRNYHPPLVDIDETKAVGAFDFLGTPIADWCELDLKCEYEENLGTPDR